MKKFLQKWGAAFLALIFLAALMPTILTRVSNEAKNGGIVAALHYNDIAMGLSKNELEKNFEAYKGIGVTTMMVAEDELNSLVSSGAVTCLKFNVLLHKYDEESMRFADELKKLPNINNDSYILLSKRADAKAFLAKWMPLKYGGDEYYRTTSIEGADIYCLYDGGLELWQTFIGYDVQKFDYAKEHGFDIAMVHKIVDYSETGYLDAMEKIIRDYNVRYLLIRDRGVNPEDETDAKEHYERISKMVKDNGMTLVLTENTNQLSDQKPPGYVTIFKENQRRVLRAYETYFPDKSDKTGYKYRYYQFLNSTIDRNIRFVVITQLNNADKTAPENAALTFRAAKDYMQKISGIGYDTDARDFDLNFDYSVNRRITSIFIALLLILAGLKTIELLFGRKFRPLTVLAAAGGLASVFFNYYAGEDMIVFYSTACALVFPCFAITALFRFAKEKRGGMNGFSFALSSLSLFLLALFAGGLVIISSVAGLDYYVNLLIFRGIKLTLFAPVAYSVFAYYMVFGKRDRLIKDLQRSLMAEIRVYWMLFFIAAAVAGAVYVIRSGNVSEISSAEEFLRAKVTDLFAVRPRTKEFLIGYPALVLFLYYIKRGKNEILPFVLGLGAALYASSVTNSFCHVFTDAAAIFQRVSNGILLGTVFAVVALVANAAALRIKDILKNALEEGGEAQ